MGAIGEGGVRVIDHEVVAAAHVNESDLAKVEQSEWAELEHRVALFRKNHRRVSLLGKTATVVDDGVATGSTVRAACLVAAGGGAARVISAVPVAARAVVVELFELVDEVVCLAMPKVFVAVRKWYSDFTQTRDEKVVEILRRSVEIPLWNGDAANSPGTS